MTNKDVRALIENRRKNWGYGNSVEAKYKAEECKDILELMNEQAEKDLELTWKDIECIIKHYQDVMAEKSRVFVRVEDYQEVLKRFKERK